MKVDMATHKRISITLHPEDIEKLDSIAEKRKHSRSGMIARLIQEYENTK